MKSAGLFVAVETRGLQDCDCGGSRLRAPSITVDAGNNAARHLVRGIRRWRGLRDNAGALARRFGRRWIARNRWRTRKLPRTRLGFQL